MVKKGKAVKLPKPAFVFNVLLSISIIFVLLHVYSYLSELEHCPCFINNENSNYVDISFLKFFQLFEIIVYVIFLFGLFSLKYGMKGGRYEKPILNIIAFISFVLFTGITGYLSYNVLYFYKSLSNDCKCANKWQKYFIYAQGAFSTLSFIRLIAAFLFITLILVMNFTK